jgi:hypothetical protein
MAGITCTEGRTILGDIFAKDGTKPDLWLGLYMDSSQPAASATLATITEVPVIYGYARIALAHADWTENPAGTFTNLQKTFLAAGGAWGVVYGYFICTSASGTAGKLTQVEHFSPSPYTVNDTGNVKVTPKLIPATTA